MIINRIGISAFNFVIIYAANVHVIIHKTILFIIFTAQNPSSLIHNLDNNFCLMRLAPKSHDLLETERIELLQKNFQEYPRSVITLS